jgi:hypothetical protein
LGTPILAERRGDQTDRQFRCYNWIVCRSRLGFGKDVQAVAISNVSNNYIDGADDSAFAICAAMFQNRYVKLTTEENG